MRYFKLKTHRMRLAAGLRSNSLGELTALPDLLVGFKRRGRERKSKGGKGRGWREGRGREGDKGREKEGKGGKGGKEEEGGRKGTGRERGREGMTRLSILQCWQLCVRSVNRG